MTEPQYKNYLELLIDLYPDDEFLIADGFDDAVIGVDYGSLSSRKKWSQRMPLNTSNTMWPGPG